MGARYPYGQRGAVDTYRTPEQAYTSASSRAIAGSMAAAAAASKLKLTTEPDPEGFLGEDAGAPASSTEDDAPFEQTPQ